MAHVAPAASQVQTALATAAFGAYIGDVRRKVRLALRPSLRCPRLTRLQPQPRKLRSPGDTSSVLPRALTDADGGLAMSGSHSSPTGPSAAAAAAAADGVEEAAPGLALADLEATRPRIHPAARTPHKLQGAGGASGPPAAAAAAAAAPAPSAAQQAMMVVDVAPDFSPLSPEPREPAPRSRYFPHRISSARADAGAGLSAAARLHRWPAAGMQQAEQRVAARHRRPCWRARRPRPWCGLLGPCRLRPMC
jgi:hypothetical protein